MKYESENDLSEEMVFVSSGKVQEVDVMDKEKEHMAILQDAVEIKVSLIFYFL